MFKYCDAPLYHRLVFASGSDPDLILWIAFDSESFVAPAFPDGVFLVHDHLLSDLHVECRVVSFRSIGAYTMRFGRHFNGQSEAVIFVGTSWIVALSIPNISTESFCS